MRSLPAGIVPGGSGSATERSETVVNWKGGRARLTARVRSESIYAVDQQRPPCLKARMPFSNMKPKRWPASLVVVGMLAVGVAGLVAFPMAAFAQLSQQSRAEPQTQRPGSVFRDCENCPEMIVIPPGNYDMGTSDDEVVTDEHLTALPETSIIRKTVSTERPRHKVSIAEPFAMAKFPVTKEEFAFFVKATEYAPSLGCTLFDPRTHRYPFSITADWSSPGFAQSDQDPVVCVNWEDANAYIAWLNSQLASNPKTDVSGPYRLPSESEWEYAARAGTQTSRWWGNDPGKNNADCAYCGSPWDNRRTAPVGSFNPNPFGLYDVLGNVTQLTKDCWAENYDHTPSDGQAWTTANCGRRIARGGSWSGDQWVIRSATRFALNPSTRSSLTGFRVAKTVQQ